MKGVKQMTNTLVKIRKLKPVEGSIYFTLAEDDYDGPAVYCGTIEKIGTEDMKMSKEITLNDVLAVIDAGMDIDVVDDEGNEIYCGACDPSVPILKEYGNRVVTRISKYDNEVVHLDKLEDKDRYNIPGIKIEL